MTYISTGARKTYSREFKNEIAQLVISGKSHIRELSNKRKIPEGNIARWVKQAKQKNGNGVHKNGVHKNGATTAVVVHEAQPGTALSTLKRPGRGGRYTAEQKAVVVEVIKSGKLPLAEISERTGIHVSTLYAWGRAAVQAAGDNAKRVQSELTQESKRVNVTEATIHLKRTRAQLIKGTRNGTIEDPYDPIYISAMQAFNALMGKGG